MTAPHTEVVVAELPDCNFCSIQGAKEPARFDFRSSNGQWAYGCYVHFLQYQGKLGLGQGQKLILEGELKDA